ncbi:MAG: hypothetical protein ACFFDW_17020 [Candidatus Thorarchaeota archaeon]
MFLKLNSYYKKYYFFISILILSFIILNITNSNGHAPVSITAEYNIELEQLSVDFVHIVSNPDTHYIQTVIITQNSEEIISESYVSQPTYDEWGYIYEFTAIEGDIINVYAECNQGGSKSITYTVGEIPTQNIPAPNIFITLTFLALTVFSYNIVRKRKNC